MRNESARGFPLRRLRSARVLCRTSIVSPSRTETPIEPLLRHPFFEGLNQHLRAPANRRHFVMRVSFSG